MPLLDASVRIAVVVMLLAMMVSIVVVKVVAPAALAKGATVARAKSNATTPPDGACNPACDLMFQQCTQPSSQSSSLECAVACPSMASNVTMNKICVKGTVATACLLAVPHGAGTSIMLQSTVPNSKGESLAITAVSDDPTQPPTFELQPASYTNRAQYFRFTARNGKLCAVTASNKKNASCNGKDCPCNMLRAVQWYKPGQYGSSTAPFSCSTGDNPFQCAATTGLGLRVPCVNAYSVLETAGDNPTGEGWAVQAAPTLAASVTSAPPTAVKASSESAWRELPGAQAHLFAPMVDPKYPAQGRMLVDSSFDRCEAGKAVHIANVAGKLLFQLGDTPKSSGSTWNVIPIRMTPTGLLNSICNSTKAQPVAKATTAPFDIKNMCCTDSTCKCSRD